MSDPLKIPQADNVFYIPTNAFWFQWCCGCGLRHIFNFEIVRGKTPEDDFICVRIAADEWATKARRKLKRLGVKTKR